MEYQSNEAGIKNKTNMNDQDLKIYSELELSKLSIEFIMDLIPQNIIIENDNGTTDFVATFIIGKIIDGHFYIEYTEGHRDVKKCDQKKAYSDWYIKDLKKGLIKAFLWRQNKTIEYRLKHNVNEN